MGYFDDISSALQAVLPEGAVILCIPMAKDASGNPAPVTVDTEGALSVAQKHLQIAGNTDTTKLPMVALKTAPRGATPASRVTSTVKDADHVGLDVNVIAGTITATVDESTLATSAKQDTGNTSLATIAAGVGGTGGAAPADAFYMAGLNGSSKLTGASIGGKGGVVIEGVASGTAVPISGSVTATVDTSALATKAQQTSAQCVSITQVAVPQTTATAICSTTACNTGVLIRALKANTATCYVGGSGCTTTNGIELDAGESVFLPVTDAALVFSCSAATGQKIQAVAL